MANAGYKDIDLIAKISVTYMSGQRTDCATCPLRGMDGCNLIRQHIDCAKVRITVAEIEKVEQEA